MNILKEHKHDIIAIFVLVIITLLSSFVLVFSLISSKENHIAHIYHENNMILSIDLSKENEERDISLAEYSLDMTLTVRKEQIKVKNSDCQSKACIHTGYISEGNIICAYNKVVIRIEASDYDLEVN